MNLTKEQWKVDKEKIIVYLEELLSVKDIEVQIQITESRYGENCLYVCDDLLIISLNSCQNFRSRLHTLLHEAGHILIWAEDGFDKKNINTSTKAGKTRKIICEILAWENGAKIANTLGIVLEECIWQKHYVQCTKEYIEYYFGGK